ncbi:pyridoxamine 5'-phosphate oxidase family protein [Longispora sp. NPDC051575]|uniref:pyridoxamine 5'-phosphate oxidase family protein n=1 Tax=Longispora sp. NPDC051575 TaxID=3154943 RepID=UPI0034240F5D
MTEHEGAARVAELAKGIRVAMFTTVDGEGRFVSRPMAQQEVGSAGELWFFAERDSRKVAHLAADSRCSVTLASDDTWISMTGTAQAVHDTAKARELWNPWVEAWLPQGPDSPEVVLIRFTGHSAEYWDTPGGKVASVISFVKSKITGERYDGGENERVRLRGDGS